LHGNIEKVAKNINKKFLGTSQNLELHMF